MANKNKKQQKKRGTPKLRLAFLAGLASSFVAPIQQAQEKKPIANILGSWVVRMTGYEPISRTWQPTALKEGLAPVVVGGLISGLVGGNIRKIGLNFNQRYMKALPVGV